MPKTELETLYRFFIRNSPIEQEAYKFKRFLVSIDLPKLLYIAETIASQLSSFDKAYASAWYSDCRTKILFPVLDQIVFKCFSFVIRVIYFYNKWVWRKIFHKSGETNGIPLPDHLIVPETSQKKEVFWSELYAHFTRSDVDAFQIANEKKLRTSSWQGRTDRVFAVNLTHTRNDEIVQHGGRQYGVIFTTPYGNYQGEEGLEGSHPDEVFWVPSVYDDKGYYIPLDLAITFGPDQEITAEDVRNILRQQSPDWGPFE